MVGSFPVNAGWFTFACRTSIFHRSAPLYVCTARKRRAIRMLVWRAGHRGNKLCWREHLVTDDLFNTYRAKRTGRVGVPSERRGLSDSSTTEEQGTGQRDSFVNDRNWGLGRHAVRWKTREQQWKWNRWIRRVRGSMGFVNDRIMGFLTPQVK
jgi:hypothetical protein